jgi:RsiW-degrading membrane proteinase PrsW (M82 family)
MRTLLFISLLPVIVIAIFIYNKDRNKEPGGLIVKLFLEGIGAAFVAIALENLWGNIQASLFSSTDTSVWPLLVKVFIGIALMEEISKWIMAYFGSYNHREFDEIYDMLLYCAFVSLGFAAFENIIYVFSGGVWVGIIRAVLSVPGHAFFGVMMGYYLGKAKYEELRLNAAGKKKNLALSIIVPTIFHGIYDYCLMTNKSIYLLVFVIFIIFMYRKAFSTINKISKDNTTLI